jgi:hypothetical protein
MRSPTGSATFECKTAVSVIGDVVRVSDIGFSDNEGAHPYRAVESKSLALSKADQALSRATLGRDERVDSGFGTVLVDHSKDKRREFPCRLQRGAEAW